MQKNYLFKVSVFCLILWFILWYGDSVESRVEQMKITYLVRIDKAFLIQNATNWFLSLQFVCCIFLGLQFVKKKIKHTQTC